VHLGRKGAPPTGLAGRGPAPQSPGPSPNQNPMSPSGNPMMGSMGGVPSNFRLPARPPVTNFQSAPAVPGRGGPKPSMAERRGMRLPGGLPGAPPSGPAAPGAPAGRKKPGLTLSQMNGDEGNGEPKKQETMLDKYSQFIDKETGSLKFAGKAILNSDGVQFASGTTFNISLDEVDTLDELGKGNYGTVYKVRHSRPRMRKPGQGLAGNKAAPGSPSRKNFEEESPTSVKPAVGTGIIMAMKEVRLELDDSKFAAIIMELDVLHRCISPFIVDFYGAFFQEGAVYICMEFMDGGSIDKLYADGVPEGVLRKITLATTMGLKSLKDEHNIIHRDVKPTNILMNTKGQIKICDFGVSGNLVASIAKTNIGCQSYMAPERISSGGIAQAGANPGGGTYSVQSDIWSLGLTIIECALGRYPYPPETYNNIFSQLSVSHFSFSKNIS
jgi:mitogen-activated protein kinase kinase